MRRKVMTYAATGLAAMAATAVLGLTSACAGSVAARTPVKAAETAQPVGNGALCVPLEAVRVAPVEKASPFHVPRPVKGKDALGTAGAPGPDKPCASPTSVKQKSGR